jgi:IclR family transcriptional regulator, acetate operon repressor
LQVNLFICIAIPRRLAGVADRDPPPSQGAEPNADRPRAAPPGTLGTVRNAVLLLELLAEGAPYRQLSELAELSALSVPTAHRLLRSLTVAGLAQQDPDSQRYSLGPELLRLSERYLARLPVLQAMAPYLVEVRDRTDATVLASVLTRGWVVYVDRVEAEDVGGVYREPMRMRPALETAAGRLLAARADGALWDAAAALARESGDGVSPSDRAEWATAEHLVVADAGDRWEAAVPIAGPDGAASAAISATGSLERRDEHGVLEQVVPELRRAAVAASRRTHG